MELSPAVIYGLILVIALIVWAMQSGTLAGFNLSQSTGLTLTGANRADFTFLKTVTLANATIDANYKNACWSYMTEHRPTFISPEYHLAIMLPLLRLICFNHILKRISDSSFRELKDSRLAMAMRMLPKEVSRARVDEYIAEALQEFVVYAKVAARSKLEVYALHEKRKDLSPEATAGLRFKMEKNQSYLDANIRI